MRKENKMDIERMLRDTTDQYNHATWQGSLHALKDLVQYIKSALKDDKTPKEVALKITKHIVAEINKYEALIQSTDVGKKMKNLGDKPWD